MAGHYPANCYPASGWLPVGEVGETRRFVRSTGRVVEFEIYNFRWPGPDNTQLWISNGFFDRNTGFAGRPIDAESLVTSSPWWSGGMYQFQILFQGDFESADIETYTFEILGGIQENVFSDDGRDAR